VECVEGPRPSGRDTYVARKSKPEDKKNPLNRKNRLKRIVQNLEGELQAARLELLKLSETQRGKEAVGGVILRRIKRLESQIDPLGHLKNIAKRKKKGIRR